MKRNYPESSFSPGPLRKRRPGPTQDIALGKGKPSLPGDCRTKRLSKNISSLARAREKEKTKAGDLTKFAQINDLLQSVRQTPEAYIDYRLRLERMGYDIARMRGMGAAESNVDRFSNRLKKRGQAWSVQGLKAIVHSLVKHFEGRLEHYSKHTSRIHNLLDDAEISKKALGITRQITGEIAQAKQTSVPIMHAGTTRSGGLSRLFHNSACDRLLTT